MRVREIMTANPACCTPETTLKEVAQMMIDHDCGLIPVVDNQTNMKPIGTVTDRDIAVRGVAPGSNAGTMTASQIMTTQVVKIPPEMSVQECSQVMKANDIRRVLVVDHNGRCVGIVAQADVAQYGPNPNLVSDVVHDISQSSPNPIHQPRQSHHRKASFKKKSMFSLNSVLPLAAGVGAGMAFKYFYGSPSINTGETQTKDIKPRHSVHLPNQPMEATERNKQSWDQATGNTRTETTTMSSTSVGSTESNTMTGGNIPKTSTFEDIAQENRDDLQKGRSATPR